MLTQTTKLNIKYQIVIPREIRKRVTLKPTDKLYIYDQDENTIVLKKSMPSITDLRGTYKFGKDYLKKERLSW